jgi:hypothetical protein
MAVAPARHDPCSAIGLSPLLGYQTLLSLGHRALGDEIRIESLYDWFMSRLAHIRPLGATFGRVGFRVGLLVFWMLVCVVAAVFPSFATAANKKVDVGMASLGEAEGSLCLPQANGAPGKPHTLTFADLKGGALAVPDDGRIVSWVVGGGTTEPDVAVPDPDASVVLDVFEPGIAQHAHIFAQSPHATSFYEDEQTPMPISPIPVLPGDEVGATLSAGGTSPNFTQAEVFCSNRGTSEYGIWEPALLEGNANGVSPKETKIGEIAVQAQVEVDPPGVPADGLSPVTGPSSGGQTLTIIGEHLANATVGVSPANAPPGDSGGYGSTQLTENTDSQIKFIVPEAVAEGAADVHVTTAGGVIVLKEAYDYKGAVAPTLPLVVTAEATSITQTSAELNGTVNPRGRSVSVCVFTYGPGEAEGEEEGEEGKEAPCSPLSFTGESAQPVSAMLTGLTPDTTYGYTLFADNESGGKGGPGSGSEVTFKTLGTSSGGGGGGSGGGGALTKELAGTAITPALSPLIPHISNTFSTPPAKVSKKGLLTFPLSAPGPGTFTALATIAGGAAHAGSAHAGIAKAKSVRYGATSVKVTQAGAVSLKISPSKAAVALLKRKHRLLLHVTLTFTPTSGTATTHVVSVVVR